MIDPAGTATDAAAIGALAVPASGADLDQLADLLCDAVAHGASVSFLAPLDRAAARAFWQGAVVLPPRGVTLVARAGDRIVGCVQLCPAWAPNQAHRAEVAKLLVHTAARRTGLGVRLMVALEAHARAVGFTLITLDTHRASPAELLYRGLGWTACGVIPGYSLDSDGQLADTTMFYKQLA